MRRMLAVIVAASLLALAPAVAQQTDTPAVDEGVESEVVVVRGVRRDRAMDAFMRGDFAVAEVEFKENLQCVERVEMLREAAIEQAGVDMDRYELNASVGINAPTIHGHGAPTVGNVVAPQLYGAPQQPDQILERTCDSRDWQLYMIALSQIQLGKLDEAREYLDRVTQRSHDPYLFDAHFRLGLIDLQNGDVERASRHLARLNRLLRGCYNHSLGCEYTVELESNVNYLTAVIAQARGQTRRQ